MYKLLLCSRYLRTRYIALACIVSVTLGVATMIVVNSVMSGFNEEMQARLENVHADVTFESPGLEGFTDAEWHMDRIGEIAGDKLEAMTASINTPGMLSFTVGGRAVYRQVQIIAVDENYSNVSDCRSYLMNKKNQEKLTFDLHEDGYDERLPQAGWKFRRKVAARNKAMEAMNRSIQPMPSHDAPSEGSPQSIENNWNVTPENDTAGLAHSAPGQLFDPAKEQHTGIVVGIGLVTYRGQGGKEHFLTVPGNDVKLTFPGTGHAAVLSGEFTIADIYESKMSDYDSAFVFVPLKEMQRMRGMIDPTTGVSNVQAIQLRVKEGVNINEVRDLLKSHFSPAMYSITTWRDKMGALLSAVEMERGILNLLLFMIIAVAGFGILAIFFMIVVEKTKDIGVLKSLGASSYGIMSIFLTYGLLLGAVGAGGGMAMGLLIVHYIDDIRHALERFMGHEVFPDEIYYFQKIPTMVQPLTVTWIVVGAMLIAVAASILPAFRAARLRPVEALRYE